MEPRARSLPWGDASIFLRLERLAIATEPALVRRGGGACQLTALGKRLLAGEADWVRESGGIDRWLGGVHLQGTTVAWRWDDRLGKLVETPA